MSPKVGKSSSSSSSSASSSASSSSSTAGVEKTEPKSKIDPSFKSKRYRDKLRTEVKALECLLPVDRTALSRKLDSQTVFRLVLALLRIKGYFAGVGQLPSPQGDNFLDINRPRDAISCDDEEDDDVTSLIQGLACLQVLEGFLLVLTTDGTILYVSDNVLQYLGYNQVDLMHRCMYSIVHYDDMPDLKRVLETSLSPLQRGGCRRRYPHTPVGRPAQESSCGLEDSGGSLCAPVSLICRMRCFSGSSVGYLKMHCSGKLVHRPGLPRTKRSSSEVVLLFCNPFMFMLKSGEFAPDLQKNAFWSKHDLDLHVKEMDTKGSDIVGFSPQEMENKSFYSLVHPEDLTALVACHKLLLESSEVQTVYFRLQTKGGDWVWLASRGKVISKNSKKFSIAFSHCPLREEDSTYLQQEAVLRRRYALTDLMYLNHFSHTQPQPPSSSSSPFCAPGMTLKEAAVAAAAAAQPSAGPPQSRKGAMTQETDQYPPCRMVSAKSSSPSGRWSGCHPSSGKAGVVGEKGGDWRRKEERGSVVDSSCVLELECPSGWHGLSDRHSPVLPSSHVAHKLSQREKQLQFQEFCKRQQLEATSDSTHGHAGKFNPHWEGGVPHPAFIPSNSDLASSATQESLSPVETIGGIGGGGGGGISCVATNPSYPNSTSSFGTLEPCVGYNPVNTAHNGTSLAPPWYGCRSVSGVSHHVSNDCSIPSRPPHQCGGVSSHGTTQFPTFQPPLPPAYGPLPHPHPPAVFGFSSMPLSPPPSPLPAESLLPPQHDAEVEPSPTSADRENYRPEFYQSWQPNFSNPNQQPAPSCYRNDAVSSGHSISTITDLQKTTEKFLPSLKKKRQDENGDRVPESCGKIQTHGQHAAEVSCHSVPDRWAPAAWTFNGQVDISWKTTVSQPFRQMNMNGSVNVQQTVTSCSQLPPYSHGHQGSQNVQLATPSPMFHAAMPQPVPQSYPYSTLYPHFGSPPACSYGVYPHFGYQGGQNPVNSFYPSTPNNIPLKVNADFPCPLVERPLDLPSIGSFLEYLSEV